jgi:molybdopterin synthase catalytic subunit
MKEEVRLSSDPIDANHLINIVRDPSAGAISTFLGTTRDNFES